MHTESGRNAYGAAGAFSSSTGGRGAGVHGAGGRNAGVVQGSGGNVYAGADGNVYRHTDNGWSKWNNSGWQPATKPTSNRAQGSSLGQTGQLEQDRFARERGNGFPHAGGGLRAGGFGGRFR